MDTLFLNKRLLNIIKWVWLVIVVAALIYYMATYYQDSITYFYSITITSLILSVIFIIFSRILLVDLIRESVKEVGWDPSFSAMFSLVSLTQLGKYIPGGVWQFAARFSAYKANQLSAKKMGKAFFMENVWVVLGGLMSGTFFILISNVDSPLVKIGVSLPSFVKNVLALLSLILWFAILLLFQMINDRGRIIPALSRTLRLFINHALMYFFMGTSFYFLFPILDKQLFLFSVGGYILGYVAGYLAIFAPGGIGVREVVTVSIFSGLAPFTELAASTIVYRLLNTAIEFTMGLVGFILMQKQKDEP